MTWLAWHVSNWFYMFSSGHVVPDCVELQFCHKWLHDAAGILRELHLHHYGCKSVLHLQIHTKKTILHTMVCYYTGSASFHPLSFNSHILTLYIFPLHLLTLQIFHPKNAFFKPYLSLILNVNSVNQLSRVERGYFGPTPVSVVARKWTVKKFLKRAKIFVHL